MLPSAMLGTEGPRPPKPRTVVWFRRYAYARLVLDLCFAALGVAAMAADRSLADWEHDADYYFILGAVFFAGGVILGLADMAAIRLAPDPQLWVVGLVLICLGLAHPCCLPVCVPLLIGWIKPETQEYYGRR